jgi:cytochrome c553
MDGIKLSHILPLLAFALDAAVARESRAADEARLQAYGRHLSQQCTACHRLDGVRIAGIPSIVGWPTDQFVAALKSYKSGERKNPVMISVTELLGEEEIKALATHFGALPTPAKTK